MAEPKRDPWNTKKEIWSKDSGSEPKHDSKGWGTPKAVPKGWDDERPSGRSSMIWWLLGAGAVLVILLVIFVILPAYRGYQIYSALDGNIPENYVTDMKGLTQDKQAAETAAQSAQDALREREREQATLQASLDSCKQDYDSCNADLTKARKLKDDVMSSLSNDVSLAKEQLQTCQNDLRAAKDAESAVIADAARRLCCIARIENSAINSFNVQDGKIVCATDGKTAITC